MLKNEQDTITILERTRRTEWSLELQIVQTCDFM